MSIEGTQDTMTLMASIKSTGESIVVTANMDDIQETLESIERFLRASGFIFDGRIGIIKRIEATK
jgi:hypothetical protein